MRHFVTTLKVSPLDVTWMWYPTLLCSLFLGYQLCFLYHHCSGIGAGWRDLLPHEGSFCSDFQSSWLPCFSSIRGPSGAAPTSRLTGSSFDVYWKLFLYPGGFAVLLSHHPLHRGLVSTRHCRHCAHRKSQSYSTHYPRMFIHVEDQH